MIDKDSERLLAQLDSVQLDPYFVHVMEQAAEIESLVNDSGNDEDELTKITIFDLAQEAIDRMDRECPHIGEPVMVTGRIKQAFYDEIEEKFGLEDVDVDRAVLISHGYTILEFGAEQPEQSVKKVGHLFLLRQMPASNDTPALVDYVPRLYAFAPVGQVHVEHILDDQENIENLQKIIPDILDEIDNRVANASDECTALLSLADMTISDKQDIPASVLSALLSYVGNRLGLDTALPYRAQLSGLAYDDMNDGAHMFSYKHNDDLDGVIIRPNALSLRRYPVLVDGTIVYSEDLHWCVDLTVYGETVTDLSLDISIPVKNISKIQSVREMMFEDRHTVQ